VTAPLHHRVYIVDDLLAVEWTITAPDGTPAPAASVAGTVTLPDETTAAMTVTNTGNVFTATYKLAQAGRHAYKLTATGATVGAVDGYIRVPRAKAGLPPITVDPTTDIGMVRLLCTDVDEVEPLFEDALIAAFLASVNGVKRAAALALDTIATSEALISKKLTTSDGLSTDGPSVAKELRERAKTLRDQADSEDGGIPGALLPVYSFPAPVSWGDDYL
jgi:hypothetical protein